VITSKRADAGLRVSSPGGFSATVNGPPNGYKHKPPTSPSFNPLVRERALTSVTSGSSSRGVL
jgi:hypothetical protein